ncbi:MAG TPA: ABC transporter permease [Pyrinomonadaceae bacterium]|nr:ABC transporter permease [Pyrinomonadaceae bacterium]
MRQLYSFYVDAFMIALKSILEHKLRAFLTLIGIIIGVAAVIVVSASIAGLKTYVIGQVSKILGSNHFMITKIAQVNGMSGDEFERLNRRNKEVNWEEYEYVRDNCQLCSYVGAQMNAGADLQEGTIQMPSVRMIGVTHNMYEIEDKSLDEGRFFSKEEVERSASVAVIGSDVKERLFEFASPIGKQIKIRGVPVTIIGMEQKRGSFFGQSQDRHVYIPITLHNQIFNRSGGLQIHGKTITNENFKPSIEEANLLLRNKRKLMGSDESTFSMVNVDEFNSTMDQVTGAIAAVVLPITAIILLVGGIVVMNIMLVSVTERTFEVGLRKALGATQSQILLQFLIESGLLCVVGGVLGILLSFGATAAVGAALGLTMTITVFYVVVSLLVSSVIGIIAGLYPAWKAARLDPIVALQKV